MSAATLLSHLHIAKCKCQRVDSGVDFTEKLLFVVFVHLLKVHPCQNVREGGRLSQAAVKKKLKNLHPVSL